MTLNKQRLTTTLNKLKELNACQEGLDTFLNYWGKDFDPNKEINLLKILESNGVQHTLWALRATNENSLNTAVLIAADCAESVLHIYKNKYPDDKRPENAIKAARDYTNVHDAVSLDTLDAVVGAADAAAKAAEAAEDVEAIEAACAACAAARAADAAAYAAVYAAAHDAYAAAYAAAHDAETAAAECAWGDYAIETNKQRKIIKKYLKY